MKFSYLAVSVAAVAALAMAPLAMAAPHAGKPVHTAHVSHTPKAKKPKI
jgi:hypothetical protein